MESVFFSMICLMLILSSSYAKPVEQTGNIDKRGATDEDCYGTNCYFDPGYYEGNNADVEVTFPENLTESVLSALPSIKGSQDKIVALLQNHDEQISNLTSVMTTLPSTLPSIKGSQDKIVALLQNHDEQISNLTSVMTTLPSTLPSIKGSQDEIVALLQNHDEQISNLTSVMTTLLGNVVNLLQNQWNLQRSGLIAAGVLDLSDCQAVYKDVNMNSDSYLISLPDGFGSFKVFCDMETNGEGWILIQKRYDGSLDFNKGWDEYEQGFGEVNGEHWMGLRNIRRLVSQEGTSWALRIDLESFDDDSAYAVYDSFMIGDAASKYRLSVGSYHGNAGNAIIYDGHNGNWNQSSMQFSTHDRDNDAATNFHCAENAKGGWWFKHCGGASLNGRYLGTSRVSWTGMVWKTWKEWNSLKRSEMKIRRV